MGPKGQQKVNDTRNVQDICSICLLLGSTNRAKTHSTGNHRWSAYDHKVIGENVSNSQNSDRNDRQVHGAKGGKGNPTPSGGNKNTGGPGGSQGKGNRTPSGPGGQPKRPDKSQWQRRRRKSKSRPNPSIRYKQRKCSRITG